MGCKGGASKAGVEHVAKADKDLETKATVAAEVVAVGELEEVRMELVVRVVVATLATGKVEAMEMEMEVLAAEAQVGVVERLAQDVLEEVTEVSVALEKVVVPTVVLLARLLGRTGKA
mmetsp:Transcript_32145/g.78093  ORF Transcript_32145/g.78093 Transcript_32145/m.78093 type:complete len:118 (-) Transcript_32145:328-681(-)